MKTKKTDDPGILLKATPHPIRQGAVVDPADVGVELRGPSTWSDGEPVKLVWVQLACTGEFRGHASGPFEMTVETFDECCRNFNARGLPLAFDYEHASEQDPTQGNIAIHGAPSCGWIHDLVNRGPDGLWGLVEWLDDAREAIKAGKYAYVSPALRLGSKDPVTGKPVGARITSAALTNQPFLSQLPPVIAASDRTTPDGRTLPPRDPGRKLKLKTELMGALPAHATATRVSCRTLHDACLSYLRACDDEEEGDGNTSMEMSDRLVVAEGEAARSTLLLRQATERIEAQDAELVTLRADKAERDERDLVAEAKLAFDTHRDRLKYGDGDFALLLSWRRSDPAGFRARHPIIDREHAHLLRDLVPPNPRPAPPASEPSEAEEVRDYQRDHAVSLADAQIAVRQIRRSRRARAAAEEGAG